jgi:hypothetical protein
MDAAIAGGAKRFLHLSSIVVFGFDFEDEVDERTPVRPNGVHFLTLPCLRSRLPG